MNSPITLNTVSITASPVRYQEQILTADALDFIAKLHQAFESRRVELMQRRQLNRARIANGHDPKFLDSTRHIREDNSWQVAPAAPGLEDRRVEIAGPIDRKSTIRALNSGAKVWMADMEDQCSPTWANVIKNQVNLRRVLDGTIDYTTVEGTVLTPRIGAALEAAAELEVGTVKVNGVFGGAPGGAAQPRRDSGAGFGYGPELLDEMTTVSVVHLESPRVPGAGR